MNRQLILSLKNAKQFLQNKDEEGNSVYEHICELINFIIVEQPERCYQNFEIISNHVKENRRNYNKLLENENENQNQNKNPNDNSNGKEKDWEGEREKEKENGNCFLNYVLDEYIKKKKEWMEKVKDTLIKNAKLKPKKLPFLFDINEQLKLINWAGYSINNNCIHFLNESIKKIVLKYNEHLLSIQFWGIVKGIKRNYYILEGELKNNSTIFNTKHRKKILKDSACSDNDKEKKKKKKKLGDEDAEEEEENSSDDDEENTTDQSEKEEEEEEEDEEEAEEEEEEEEEDTEDTDDDEEGGKYSKNKKGKREKQKRKEKLFNYEKEDYEYFNKNVNKHIYFVSIDGESEWILLNFIDPETIKVASKIQKICTGNLEHIITSYPNIVMKEKIYLRALIAIISAGTHIAPKNYFTIGKGNKRKKEKNKKSDQDEENKSEEEDEEVEENENHSDNSDDDTKGKLKTKQGLITNKKFQFDLNNLSDLNNWVYHKYGFLKNGHIHYPKSINTAKNKKNKKLQYVVKKNPPLNILRNIIEGIKKTEEWKLSHLNAGHYYGKENSHYDIIVIYNMIFYGAFTIYFNKQFFNFYIGTGIRSFNVTLHTYAPGKVQSDQSELSEVEYTEKT